MLNVTSMMEILYSHAAEMRMGGSVMNWGKMLPTTCTNSVTENCPRLSNYSEYQCTNSCRDALQNLKSNLGCCLNNLYNTISPSSNFLNTGLWSACRVIHPDFCHNSTLILGSVTSNNCSGSYLYEQLYAQVYCIAEVFQPFLDLYQHV